MIKVPYFNTSLWWSSIFRWSTWTSREMFLTLTAESASLRQLSTARKCWTLSRRLTTFGVFFGTYFPWNQQFAPENKPFAPLIFGGYVSFREGWNQNSTRFSKRFFLFHVHFFFKTSFQNWNKKQTWRCLQIWFAQKNLFDFSPRKSSDSPPTPTNLPKGRGSTGPRNLAGGFITNFKVKLLEFTVAEVLLVWGRGEWWLVAWYKGGWWFSWICLFKVSFYGFAPTRFIASLHHHYLGHFVQPPKNQIYVFF